MLLKIRILFFVLLFVFGFSIHSYSKNITSLSGHAFVELKNKKKIYRFDQIIIIKNLQNAKFETLDDFGNTLFKLAFLDNSLMIIESGIESKVYSHKKLKKILSLPLEQNEFLSYLLYQLPQTKDEIHFKTNEDGLLIFAEKKTNRKKNSYKIFFRNFLKKGSITYPQEIEIKADKTQFILTWQDIRFH